MKAIKEKTQALAPIAKGSCQPSKARMTEGLKSTKKLKRDKGSNPSVAAALPRRATSPDSGEADYLTALMPDLRRFLAKEPNIHSSHTQQELQSTLAPIVKGSCQPSKARMTEGLKATKKLKRDKGSNPSGAAALPRRATSPDSGEAYSLTSLIPDFHQTLSKDCRLAWLPLSRGAVSRAKRG